MKSTTIKAPPGFAQAMEKAERELSVNLPSWAEASACERVKLCFLNLAIMLPILLIISFVSISCFVYMYFYVRPLMVYVKDPPALYFYHSEEEFQLAYAKGWVCGTSLTVLILLFVWSYFQAIRTCPGFVEKGRDEEPLIVGNKSEKRFCDKCDLLKPERAHHCQQCESCILLMDHHCNWLANCVGLMNYKFFMLTLFYACLALLLYSGTFWECAGIYIASEDTSTYTAFVMVLVYTLVIALSLVLVPFFGFHVWKMGKNITTIEYIEKKTKASKFDKGWVLSLIHI